MKLRIQTLTGQIGEVEVDPQNTILDLKVSRSVKGRGGSRLLCHSLEMQVLGKFDKIVCWCLPLDSWHPHLGEILDPPLLI